MLLKRIFIGLSILFLIFVLNWYVAFIAILFCVFVWGFPETIVYGFVLDLLWGSKEPIYLRFVFTIIIFVSLYVSRFIKRNMRAKRV